MRTHVLLAIAVAIACSYAGMAEAKKSSPDQTLWSQYSPDGPPGTGYDLDVCGQVGNTSGCYGGGTMLGFDHACAIIEGSAKTKGSVMTRDVYVLDERSNKNDPGILYVYERKDTFGTNSDTIELNLKMQVTLDLHSGSKGKCFMAASDATIFAGTSASTQLNEIDKKALTATSFNVGLMTSITADDRGNIAIDDANGFGIIPYWNSSAGQGGGGEGYLSNTRNAWVP